MSIPSEERWDCLSEQIVQAALLIPFKLEEDDDDFDQDWEIAQQMQAMAWEWA